MFENNEKNNNSDFSEFDAEANSDETENAHQKTIQVKLENDDQEDTTKNLKQKYAATKVKKGLIDTQKLEEKRSQKKLKDFKLKVGIFLIAIIVYFLWGDFNNSFKQVESANSKVESLTQQVNAQNREIGELKSDKDLIVKTEKELDNILACFNEDESLVACNDIPAVFTGKMDIVRNYLLLGKLKTDKMDFDQKLMIKSITKNLMKNWGGQDLGELKIVSFGTPRLVNYDTQLYQLQLSINVTLSDIDKLLELLSNVEVRVPKEDKVMYRLESVDYNIMEYKNEQTINVNLSAFFYK